MTQYVPLAPREIIDDVLRCCGYGVSMVHLHARNDNGSPTWVKETYDEIIRGIRRERNDLIICVSTSGRDWSEFEKRAACLECDADMASLTLSSLNFNKQASVNEPEMIQRLAKGMMERGIKPELEAFDVGMINYAKYLKKKGLIEEPFYVNLILGNIACAQPNILNLGVMLSEIRDLGETYWSVGGVGDCQLRMNIEGLLNGGGVRVGLEDNIYFDESRTTLATNSKLVGRIWEIAGHIGIEIASPSEVRESLGLRKNVE